jgi:type I restriction-modification system DNA methylase subunit
MHDTLVGRITRRLYSHGITGSDACVGAAALVTAWFEDRYTENPRSLFQAMSRRLDGVGHADGLSAAADWLDDPGFSNTQWDALAAAQADLRHAPARPIDWTAELDASFVDRRFVPDLGPSTSVAKSLNRVLDIPLTESCACMFAAASSLAWEMSGSRQVTLFTGDRDVAVIVALLARSASRSLKVDRCNPMDGSFTSSHFMGELVDREPPFDRFDHIVTLPPFGMRVQTGEQKGLPLEAAQIERLAPRATRSFTTIVTDGLLFRENRQETALRQNLIERYEATVMSLPGGIFVPASGIQASIVRLERNPSERSVVMVDGRSMEKPSTGKALEQQIARHLETFQGLRPRDEDRGVVIEWDELQASNFSLLPERYVKSESLARIEDSLRDRPTATLEQIATIERAKAPVQMRDPREDPPLTAMEIAPSDLEGGIVRTPRRQLAFEEDQRSTIAKVTVEPGDVLVSIKGNVGRVGLVGLGASLAEVMKDPWVVSQSLAIIRLKAGGPISSPEVLNAILTAPWVQEKLESMSGGATVRTLPISALRSLSIPIPTREAADRAAQDLADVSELRARVADLVRNIDETQSAIWHSLWHIAPETGVQ